MSRRATAVLEVQVIDTSLDQHLEKLEAVRAAWTFLGGNLTDLAASFSKGTGDELKKVSQAIAAMANVKSGGGAADVVKALSQSKPHLAGLADELEKVAKVTKTLSNDSVRWARALTKASAEVGRLETRTDSLISSQERTTEHMKQFEEHLDATTKKLKTQGAELLELIQAYAGFNRAASKASGGGGSGGGGGKKEGTIKGFLDQLADLERSFIRHATTLFISGQWFKEAAEAFRDAAAQVDLENVLGRSVDDFGNLMERTRESTRGMVSDLQIMKSAAIMSSFKIPMEKFADNMALVQKMAVRTGQDTTYMFDSLARGVSRLSPAILDNLGIQIKLKEAYEAGAAARGVSLDQMDKEAQKVAVLAEVTRQMQEATKEVDPAASLQSRIDQMEASYTNFTQKLKGEVLQAILLVASTEEERLAITKDRLALLIKEQEKYGKAVSDSAKNVIVATGDMSQKNLDMTLMFSQLNPLLMFESSQQGYESINDMLAQQLELQGLAYNSAGKTLEQNRQAAKVQEERLFAERMLFQIDERIARQKEYIAGLESDAGLEDWNVWKDDAANSKNIAAQQKWLENFERVRTELSTGFRAVETFRAGIDEMAKSLKGTEQGIFKDEARNRITDLEERITAFQKKMSPEMDPRGTIAEGFLTQGGADWIKEQIAEIEKSVRKQALDSSAQYRIKHAAEIKTVENLDESVRLMERQSALLQGQKDYALDLSEVEAKLKTAREAYAKARENSKALGEGEADQDNIQLATAQSILSIWQVVYDVKFKTAETAEYYQKFLDAELFGAKELKDMEFLRLSGGKSRLQIEAEMLKVSTRLLAIEQGRALAAKELSESAYMALATDLLKEGKEAEATLARLQKLISMAPKAGGGGKKDKTEKAKTQKFSAEFEYQPDDIKRNLVEIVKSMDGVTQLYIRQFEDTASGVFKLTKSLVQDFKKESETSGLFGLGTNFDAMIEHNEEIISDIDKIAEEYGIMTYEMQQLKNETALANDVLREHRDVLLDISKATSQWADANAWAWDSAKGLIGDDFIEGFTGLGDAVKDVSDKIQAATQGEANGYDVLLAGMGGIRAFSNAFIKDRKDRAKIEALMNGAAAFAAAGYGNWPAAAAHAQAAIMYGLVAGGKVRLPSESRKDTKDAETKTSNGGPLHIHLHGAEGMSEGQIGAFTERAVSIAQAEGRASYG